MSQAKDPYVYPGTTTLINTFNIRDKTKLDRVETKFSAIRLTTANQKNVPGKFDYEHLKNIHKHIFKDIYPFAGKDGVKKNPLQKIGLNYSTSTSVISLLPIGTP